MIRLSTTTLLLALLGGCASPSEKTEVDPKPTVASVIRNLETENAQEAATHLESLADEGNANAAFALGLLHDIGVAVPLDSEKALKLLQSAAQQNHGAALHYLAWKYAKGFQVEANKALSEEYAARGLTAEIDPQLIPQNWLTLHDREISPNFHAAFTWVLDSAEKGDAVAMSNLSDIYLSSWWIIPSASFHLKWLQKAADYGSATALHRLSLYYAMGLFLPVDKVKARAYQVQAAEAGHAEAQYQLGSAYEEGEEQPKNLTTAAFWYRKAAAQDHQEALLALAALLKDGAEIGRDDVAALKFYKRAAQLGNIEALAEVGWMLENGRGGEVDLRSALSFYQQAADAGNSWGQYRIGRAYQSGDFGAPDFSLAHEWYQKAAQQGSEYAMNHLGWIYENGKGVTQDPEEAFMWYERAAREGNHWAQAKVGQLLLSGFGVEKDPQEAFSWFKLSAEGEETLGLSGLGYCYLSGSGIEQSYTDAVKNYLQSFRQGSLESYRSISGLFRNPHKDADELKNALSLLEEGFSKGDPQASRFYIDALLFGVPPIRNVDQGMKLLQSQVEREQGWAFQLLAESYWHGLEGTKDFEKAWHYAQKAQQSDEPFTNFIYAYLLIFKSADAAESKPGFEILKRYSTLGDVVSSLYLAESYASGNGGPQDEEKAWHYLELAAQQGAPNARAAIEAASQGRWAALKIAFPKISRPAPAVVSAPDEAEIQRRIAVILEGKTESPIQPVYQSAPVYPRWLRILDITGKVRVEFIVDTNGRVMKSHMRVVQTSDPRFNDAAMEAVAKWRFAPALKEGRRVNTRLQVPIIFKLN